MNLNKIALNISVLSLCIFLLFGPLTISTVIIKLTIIPLPALIASFSSFCLFLLFLINKKKKKPSYSLYRHEKVFIGSFFIPILLSFLSLGLLLYTMQSIEYLNYVRGSLPTRMLYYLVFFLTLFLALKLAEYFSGKQVKWMIWSYIVSAYSVVVIGIWQLLYFIYDVPFIYLPTRSHLHSVSGNTMFNFRLTSFADEPSYLGPILIDLVLLSLLVVKNRWVYTFGIALPALVVMMFSFSLSAYANLLILACFIIGLLLISKKHLRKWILIGIAGFAFIFIAIALVKSNMMLDFFRPILARFENMFDLESNSRFYMYVLPTFLLFDFSWVTSLFGYGPGSFSFVSMTRYLPNTATIGPSSNNLYFDVLFETGIVGLIIFLIGIVWLFIHLFKKRSLSLAHFVSLVLFVHLLITSLYRADYVTPRFWGILLIIMLLARTGRNKQTELNDKNELS